LNFSNKKPIRCKVAKYIRLPKVHRIRYKSDYFSFRAKADEHSDLCIYEHGANRTIFFITGDIIRFINQSFEEYRDTNLITLFDRKNNTYNLIGINSQKYEEYPKMFIKAPNGDLYCIFDYSSFVELDSKFRVFIINNLTKGKVLFSYIDKRKYKSYWEDDLDSKLFPTFTYTSPLYNSFIIIIRTDTHNALETSSIYLVDLVEEKVEEIPYDLKGYIKSHIDDFIYAKREHPNIDFTDASTLREPRIKLYRLSPFDSLVSAWGEISDDCKLIKYQNETPIYSECQSALWLYLRSIIYLRYKHEQKGWKEELSCAVNIYFSVYVKDNELNILLTCKGVKISVFGYNYNKSKDDILLHKKYSIHGKYNIDESQLCSITTIDRDYLIKDTSLYKLVENEYKPIYKFEDVSISVLRREGVYFVTVNNGFTYAVVRPNLVRGNRSYVNIPNGRIVYWNKMNEVINMYREQNKPIAIIDVNEYIKRISISDLIHNISKEIQKRGVKYKDLHYEYYFSEETGDLYIFMALYQSPPPRIRFAIAKHNIQRKPSQAKILFLSSPHRLDSKHQLPYYEQIELKKQGRLLNEIINSITSKKDKNIYFLDFLNYSFDIANEKHSVFFVYDDELIIRCNIPAHEHDGRVVLRDNIPVIEFKDIKYNRKNELQYKGENEIKIVAETDKPKIQLKTGRYGKLLFHWTEIDGVRYPKHMFVFVVSEMELVRSVEFKTYDIQTAQP
jgi:hypothetical protein